MSGRADAQPVLTPRLAHDAAAPALVLSPHWDDAVLSCWSVLAADAPVNVANVFAAIPAGGRAGPWEALLSLPDAAARAGRRREEDTRALARAGREPRELQLLDRSLRGTAAAPPLAALDAALCAQIAAASHVYVPAGIGGHADHLLVRSYGRALLGAGVPVSAYAELPYCAAHGWPLWVDGIEDGKGDVEAYWRYFMQGLPEAGELRSALVVRLDQIAFAAKAEAVAEYEASLGRGVRRQLADPAVGAFEVRWALERQRAAS